jgi:hypothetical protein
MGTWCGPWAILRCAQDDRQDTSQAPLIVRIGVGVVGSRHQTRLVGQPSALVRIHSAVDQERLVGHVGVEHKHHDGFNNVFRLAEPANRDARHKFSFGTRLGWEHACISNQARRATALTVTP